MYTNNHLQYLLPIIMMIWTSHLTLAGLMFSTKIGITKSSTKTHTKVRES